MSPLYSRARFLRVILSGIVLAMVSSYSLSSKADPMTDDAFYERCMRWLTNTYEGVLTEHLIYRYVRNNFHRLRGNYLIKPYGLDETMIGFECEYNELNDYFLALPDTNPFPPDAPAPNIGKNLREIRVWYAFSACPAKEQWNWFAKEIERGNYAANLPLSCVMLKRGDRFWVNESPIMNSEPSELAQIIIENGQTMWIEPESLDQY